MEAADKLHISRKVRETSLGYIKLILGKWRRFLMTMRTFFNQGSYFP